MEFKDCIDAIGALLATEYVPSWWIYNPRDSVAVIENSAADKGLTVDEFLEKHGDTEARRLYKKYKIIAFGRVPTSEWIAEVNSMRFPVIHAR